MVLRVSSLTEPFKPRVDLLEQPVLPRRAIDATVRFDALDFVNPQIPRDYINLELLTSAEAIDVPSDLPQQALDVQELL